MTKNRRLQLPTTTALLLMAVSAASIAAEPALTHDWYRVELILFERNTVETTVGNERLALDKPRYLPNRTVAFDLDDAMRFELFRLSPQQIDALKLPESPVLIPEISARSDGASVTRTFPDDARAEWAPPTDPTRTVDEVPRATITERALRARTDAVRAFEGTLIETAFRLQSQSSHMLTREAARIRTNPAFEVVWHGAWQQPVPPRNEPLPILFQAGPRIGDRFTYEGTLAVTLGRFLHLHASLWRESHENGVLPHGSFDTGLAPQRAAAGRYEHLDEQRRMRSTELHYIDHPRFGLLVRIDPVSVPEHLLDLDRYRDVHEETPQ
jgi:hypothetical protein